MSYFHSKFWNSPSGKSDFFGLLEFGKSGKTAVFPSQTGACIWEGLVRQFVCAPQGTGVRSRDDETRTSSSSIVSVRWIIILYMSLNLKKMCSMFEMIEIEGVWWDRERECVKMRFFFLRVVSCCCCYTKKKREKKERHTQKITTITIYHSNHLIIFFRYVLF